MKIYLIAAKIHDSLGITFRKLGNFILICRGKVFFSLAVYHFSKAYLLYLRQGNREKALKVYGELKHTKLKKYRRFYLRNYIKS